MKDDRPLEAVITAGLKNPGIVRTIAYSWLCHRDSRGLDEAAEAAESATPSPAASTAWDSANSHPRQSAREMWMLLEYCDRGCLVVRAARRPRAAALIRPCCAVLCGAALLCYPCTVSPVRGVSTPSSLPQRWLRGT